MDIRHNGHFYRTTGKSTSIPPSLTETSFDLDSATPNNNSNKILLTAYKNLIQNFNQLTVRSQTKWQLEINIIARQLTHLFKQAAKGTHYSGYPALNLLKEIRQLDEQILGTEKEVLASIS